MSNRFNKRTSDNGQPYGDWFTDNVDCPTCGAEAGIRCTTIQIKAYKLAGFKNYPYPTTTHKRRKDLAKTLYLIDQVDRSRLPEFIDLATA